MNILQPHLKTLYIRETSRSPDKAVTEYSGSFSPDCTVYDQANKDLTETNSAQSDIYIEFKCKPEEGAFLTNIASEESSVSGPNPLISQTARGTLTAGQMTTYAALQLDSQYRTHVFSILVVKDYARLMRWDRSGAIVTEPIYYQRDATLLDFHSLRSSRDLCVDTTTAFAEPRLQKFSKPSKLTRGSLFRRNSSSLPIPLHGTESKPGEYIIKPTVANPYTPPGRATRTSIAYDTQRNRPVFFKDSWRVACNGIVKEGDVYAILNGARVCNVPRCSASGDVGEEAHHSTHTSTYAGKDWVWQKDTPEFTPHWHHQLILDNIGAKLETFRCSKDMVRAVLPALNAHKDAYWKCGVLHRDMSPSNILWTESTDFEGGLLIDWDLCKMVDPNHSFTRGVRQSTRTGTWQFMAADLVENPKINQTFIHDIESAFFILLWMSIIYIKSDWDRDRRSSFVDSIFNSPVYGSSGGSMKTLFMRDDRELRTFNLPNNKPLTRLLRVLKNLLAVRHKDRPEKVLDGDTLSEDDMVQRVLRENAQGTDPASILATTDETSRKETELQERLKDYDARMAALKNHDTIIRVITNALGVEDKHTLWPAIEPAERQAFVLSHADKRYLRSSSK